jgi:hypothetical protein
MEDPAKVGYVIANAVKQSVETPQVVNRLPRFARNDDDCFRLPQRFLYLIVWGGLMYDRRIVIPLFRKRCPSWI